MLREVKNVIEDCAAQQTALVVLSAGGLAAPAVADLLASLGCDAPQSGRNGANKISDFNNDLLDSSGTEANHWSAFNTKWLASPKAAEFLNRALELLQSEFDGSYLSLVQDSATARLLPFWNVAFDRAGIVPRYLFIVSDPADVAEDLHDRFEIEPGAGQLVWLRSVLDAEMHSRGRLRAFADTAQVSEHPATTVNSLAQTLQLTFPRDVQSTFASQADCLQQLRDLVRRSSERATSDRSEPVTADWVSVTHTILRRWALEGEAGDARTVLDALREAFDEAVPVFEGVGQGSVAKNSKLRELQQQLETLQAEFQRAQESMRRVEDEARHNIAKAEARARSADEAGKEAKKELQGRVSHLESALAQRTAEIDETWKLLNESRSQISSIEQELAASRKAARTEIEKLRNSGEKQRQALEEGQEQLRSRYSEIVTLTRMLATETSSARKFERTAERLRSISQVLESGATARGVVGWLQRIMPSSWRVRRMTRRLERDGLFDAAAYLNANPDVQSAGVDPLRHYLSHGAIEGRPLGFD